MPFPNRSFPLTATAATPAVISSQRPYAATVHASQMQTNTASAHAKALKKKTGLMRNVVLSAASTTKQHGGKPMDARGHIFDIQSFSVHDGPGCRTTVFMTGCPLQCRWCANPESWIYGKHLMFAQASCKWDKGCDVCLSVCPTGAITMEPGQPLRWTGTSVRIVTTFPAPPSAPTGH